MALAACSSTRSSSKSTMARTPRPPKGDGTGRTDRARSIRDAWMHAGSWQSLHLAFLIVPARPRAGRGGRRARSVECAGEREVRAWTRPGGGSGGRRRERVRAGVCDRYGIRRDRARYRDCFRSTSTVDTYSRTYRGTYSLTTLTSTVTTHHKLILTSIAGRTSPRAGVGARTAVRVIAREVARRRVTFLTVTFRHGPRISLPSPRWLRPRTSPAAVRAIATTTMLPTRAGR